MLAGIGALSPGRPRGYPIDVLLIVLIFVAAGVQLPQLRRAKVDPPTERFYGAVQNLPPGPNLVFVRYGPWHSFYREWVYNEADLDEAENVFAHDLGDSANARLCAAFPDRKTFLYTEYRYEADPYAPLPP